MMKFIQKVIWYITDCPREFLAGFFAVVAVSILATIGGYLVFTTFPFLAAMVILAFVLAFVALILMDW